MPAGNFHITLKFLGSTPVERLQQIEALGASAAMRAQALSLTLDTLSWWERPQVLVLGASRTPSTLADLVGALEAGARALGYEPELRPYRPHLTLARKVRRAPDAEPPAPVEWRVDALALCESTTRADGAEYAAIAQWPLGGGDRAPPVE
jgi:2'-5' RNA ligase